MGVAHSPTEAKYGTTGAGRNCWAVILKNLPNIAIAIANQRWASTGTLRGKEGKEQHLETRLIVCFERWNSTSSYVVFFGYIFSFP
jgi:hypothetical protein